jgi:hypothetical protein
MVTSNFFYEVSMAENGGFGIWYEYIAKSRIFNKFKNSKKVLIFGLPEKYSLGLDTLFFADNSELNVVDNRKKVLEDYKKYADKFSKKIKTIYIKNLNEATKLKKNKYDLLISTEVLQNDISLMSVMKDLAKEIIVFVPNKQGYAHPRISHLKSLSLKRLKEIGKQAGMKIVDSGYIDCPPWPAGATLPKEEKKEGLAMKLVKKILTRITPLLSKFDSLYLSPWKEINSHMIFGIFIQNER